MKRLPTTLVLVAVAVASVAADGASMTVVVPDTTGYPVIAVEDVAPEDAPFVGHTYTGPLTLIGIQAALDPLLEGADLRVEGGELVVSRGRLATAAAEASVGFATALLTDLGLDMLRTPGADVVEVILRESAVTATGMEATAELGRLRIEGTRSALVGQDGLKAPVANRAPSRWKRSLSRPMAPSSY